MIERYTTEEMKKIWELNSKFDYYLKVEIAVCEAYAELGEFPKEDVLKIKQLAKFDVKRIDEIERVIIFKDKYHSVLSRKIFFTFYFYVI